MTCHLVRVETTKEWKSTLKFNLAPIAREWKSILELQPGRHGKGSGFQSQQAAASSMPSSRKKVTREKETSYKKRPPSLGVNHCPHPRPKTEAAAREGGGSSCNNIQDARQTIPHLHLSRGNVIKELRGEGEQPEKV